MSALLLAASLGAVGLVALTVVGRPVLAVPLVVATSLVASSGLDRPVAQAGGINLFPTDLLTATLLATLAIQFGAGRRFHRAALPWAGLVVLVAVSLVRGVGEFGVQQAFQSYRALLVMLTVGLFFSAQFLDRRSVLAVLRTSLAAASVVLAVTAGLYVARFGLNRFGVLSADGTPDRPLNAPQAVVVMMTMLLLLGLDRRRSDRWWAAACALLLVLSQQRTVWIATLVALFVLWTTLTENRQLRRRVAALVTVAGVALTALVLMVPSSPAASAIRRAVQEPFNESNTLTWRVEGWKVLVDAQIHGDLTDLAMGTPAGSGSTRRLPSEAGGALVSVSAHSQWVTELLVGGVLAVVLFALATVVPTARLWRRGVGPARSDPLLALAVSALVFSISYQLGPAQSLVLGLVGVSAAVRPVVRRQEGPDSYEGSDGVLVHHADRV